MIRSLATLVFLSIIYFGCSNRNDFSVPPKILLAQDACDNCFMIINEKKFAASVRLENGEAKRFDDIGCMISFANSGKKKIKYYWVYDFITKKPVKGEDAFLVRSGDLVTPMGNGIAAFLSKENAEKFAEKYNTKVLSLKSFIKNINK